MAGGIGAEYVVLAHGGVDVLGDRGHAPRVTGVRPRLFLVDGGTSRRDITDAVLSVAGAARVDDTIVVGFRGERFSLLGGGAGSESYLEIALWALEVAHDIVSAIGDTGTQVEVAELESEIGFAPNRDDVV